MLTMAKVKSNLAVVFSGGKSVTVNPVIAISDLGVFCSTKAT